MLKVMSPFCRAEMQYHGQMVPRVFKAQLALSLKHLCIGFNYLSVVILNY